MSSGCKHKAQVGDLVVLNSNYKIRSSQDGIDRSDFIGQIGEVTQTFFLFTTDYYRVRFKNSSMTFYENVFEDIEIDLLIPEDDIVDIDTQEFMSIIS